MLATSFSPTSHCLLLSIIITILLHFNLIGITLKHKQIVIIFTLHGNHKRYQQTKQRKSSTMETKKEEEGESTLRPVACPRCETVLLLQLSPSLLWSCSLETHNEVNPHILTPIFSFSLYLHPSFSTQHHDKVRTFRISRTFFKNSARPVGKIG